MQILGNPRFDVSLSELCIRYGCAALTSHVQQVFEMFKRKYLESLHKNQAGNIDFSRPIYMGACIFVAATYAKYTKVEMKKIIGDIGCNETEFKKVCESIDNLCIDLFKDDKVTITTKKVKPLAKEKKVERVGGSTPDDDEKEVDELFKLLDQVNGGKGKEETSEGLKKRDVDKIEDGDDESKVNVDAKKPKLEKPKQMKQVKLAFFN